MKIPDVPLIIDDEVGFESKGQVLEDEPLVIPSKEKIQALKDEFDPQVVNGGDNIEPSNITMEKEGTAKEELSQPPSLSVQPEKTISFSPDILSQQMMYINMMQQQIATLQSQMLSMSSGQMNGFNGAPLHAFGNPFWMQQTQYQQAFMPPQPLNTNNIPNSSKFNVDKQQNLK